MPSDLTWHTPEWLGYMDREIDEELKQEARETARYEAMERDQ
jgi:hypothetical protein